MARTAAGVGPARRQTAFGRAQALRCAISGVVAQLGEDRVGVLAERRHRVHARRRLSQLPGGSMAGSGPAGDLDLAPAVARLQLRVLPDVVHRVDARVGDLRRFEPLDHLRRGQRGEGLDDQRTQLVARRRRASRCRRSAGRVASPGWRSTVVAEGDPFALVLQAQHHPAAVAGRERAVGIDRRVAGAGARRRRRAVEGVVERVARPLGQRLRASRCRCAGRGRSGRAAAAPPGCWCRRTCRRRCRRSRGPPCTARRRVPVTETKPASLWISRS